MDDFEKIKMKKEQKYILFNKQGKRLYDYELRNKVKNQLMD